jgi:hypothetical protein
MVAVLTGAGLDSGLQPEVGGAENYMSPEYIAKWGHEPAVRQKVERQKIATAQADISAAIKAAYPGDKPVSFRMKNTGVVLTQGLAR